MSRLEKYAFAQFGFYSTEAGKANVVLKKGRYAGWSAEIPATMPNAPQLLPGMMTFVKYRICTNGFKKPRLVVESVEFGAHVDRLSQLVLDKPTALGQAADEWIFN